MFKKETGLLTCRESSPCDGCGRCVGEAALTNLPGFLAPHRPRCKQWVVKAVSASPQSSIIHSARCLVLGLDRAIFNVMMRSAVRDWSPIEEDGDRVVAIGDGGSGTVRAPGKPGWAREQTVKLDPSTS